MTAASEAARLKSFWDGRYRQLSLRESGIITLSDEESRLLYRCKQAAYLKALRIAAVPPAAPVRILDAGCGQGFFAELALARFAKLSYAGIDISEKAINFLRQRHPELAWSCADLGAADLDPGGPFDVVQAIEVLHLILPDEHQGRAVSNLGRAVAVGGVLILTDALPPVRMPVGEYIVFRPLAHYAELFHQLRLTLIAVFPIYYWFPDLSHPHHPLRLLFRLLPARLIYLVDRLLLHARAPQLRPSHDSQMKMMVLRRAPEA